MTPIAVQDSGTSGRLSNIELSALGASSALKAGLVYFAIVFAIGFALRMIRVPSLGPWLGDLIAVLIELPIIMTSAWLICWKIVRPFEAPPTISFRLLMGGVALVVLLIAAFSLPTLAFGYSIVKHVRVYLSAPHAHVLVG